MGLLLSITGLILVGLGVVKLGDILIKAKGKKKDEIIEIIKKEVTPGEQDGECEAEHHLLDKEEPKEEEEDKKEDK